MAGETYQKVKNIDPNYLMPVKSKNTDFKVGQRIDQNENSQRSQADDLIETKVWPSQDRKHRQISSVDYLSIEKEQSETLLQDASGPKKRKEWPQKTN